MVKLNVYIARSGRCSRRKADALIKEGEVTVNGGIILHPWYNIKEGDRVEVRGKVLAAEDHAYIIFNKPYGVTSTVEDRFASRKVVDVVPKNMGRLYPVGRLDRMSRGLIILTNDGELCQKLTHPKFEIEKEYLVTIRGPAPDSLPAKLVNGAEDGGDFLSVKSADIAVNGGKRSVIRAIVCEGKKRHIRRLFLKLGLNVLDLKRVRIGNLLLGDMREGSFKILSRDYIYSKTLGAAERSVKDAREKDTRCRR